MYEYKSDILSYNDEAFDELQNTSTLINSLLLSCQDKEFRGQYYDIPEKSVYKLSEERNSYLSLLSMASDKLYNLKKIHLNIEKKLSTLHKYTDNCCR